MLKLTKKVLSILDEKQKSKVIIIVFMMLIGAIMESLGVSMVYPLVDAITAKDNWSEPFYAKMICNIFNISSQRKYIVILLVVLIVVFFVKNCYLMIERYIQNSFIAKSRLKMQKDLMAKYMKKPYEFFINSSSGDIIRVISGDTLQIFTLLSYITTIFTEGFICLVIGITLIVMNPLMSSFFVVLMIIEVLVLTKVVRPFMGKIGNDNRIFTAKANEWMIGAINGIKSIKVSNTSDFFVKMYSENSNKTVDSQRKSETINTIPKVVIETITMDAVLLMILIMVINNCELSTLVPILSAFAIAALRLLPCVSTLTTAINGTKYLEGSLDNIIQIINDSNDNELENIPIETREKITFCKSIKMNNVSFKYKNTTKYILKDAKLTIKSGESIGIVGPSGAGKTTTVDIILGLLKPSYGEILVDGIDIRNNMRSWLSKLAYIPQQIFLMDDTIRSNVAFGIEEDKIDDNRVWEALKEAQLDEFVKELPDGLNSKVGERGTRLSGGQCQRIGIARALYNNPEILVFDEATSALDNETEKAIMKSINNLKGRKTMIIIAHRLTTIENCDIIYRVEKGKITKISK